MMKHRYMAIDPGVGTGVAVYQEGTFHSWESFDLSEVAEDVRSFVGRTECELVTEKFIISQRTVQGKVYYESLYFNGWLSIEYPHRHEQTAAQAKGFVSDAMLRHLGWYVRSKDGHANDAARHLVYRAVKHNRERHLLTQLEEFLTQ